MNKWLHQLQVLGYFFWRDLLVFKQQWKRLVINFGVIVPVVFSISFGYFVPQSNMTNPTALQATIFFVGCILWSIFPLAFVFNLDFLYDLENDRYVDYQMIVLDPRLLLLEKIVFSSLVTFVTMSVFYPISYLLLGKYFYGQNIAWGKLFLVLYLGSLFCSAFNIFMLCFIENTKKIGNFWIRINMPILNLGGLFIPWSVMMRYSMTLGIFSLLNPLLYLTEGIRQAIIGGHDFFSIITSSSALILFSLLFYGLCCYYFKKKVDYVS